MVQVLYVWQLLCREKYVYYIRLCLNALYYKPVRPFICDGQHITHMWKRLRGVIKGSKHRRTGNQRQ